MRYVTMPFDRDATSIDIRGNEEGLVDWLEHLTDAHSSKPGYYAAWRRSTEAFKRLIPELQEISVALRTTAQGASELSRSVAVAFERQFDAWCAAVIFPDDADENSIWNGAVARVDGKEVDGIQDLPALASSLGERCAQSKSSWLIDDVTGDFHELSDSSRSVMARGLAAPIFSEGVKGTGSLVALFRRAILIDQTDLAILQILANQTAAVLENAFLFRTSENLRVDAMSGWEEARRRSLELEQQNQQLRDAQFLLLQAHQRVLVEEERTRIATELHDSVAQYLIGIGMNLEWCRRQSYSDKLLEERLESIQELSRVALATVRTTIFELSCLGNDGGLVPALDDLAGQFRSQVDVNLRVQGSPRSLAPFVEHAVFHCIQEAMFNTVRHGNAKRIWVSLNWNKTGLRVSVADDGIGDPEAIGALMDREAEGGSHGGADGKKGVASRGGMGIMRHRAAEIGGQISIRHRHGGGVKVSLAVPLSGISGTPERPGFDE